MLVHLLCIAEYVDLLPSVSRLGSYDAVSREKEQKRLKRGSY